MTKIPASESEAVAVAHQPDEPKAPPTEFVVADVHDNGTVTLKMPDERMFNATLAEGVEVKRHALVVIKNGEVDKHGVPKDAVVTKVKP